MGLWASGPRRNAERQPARCEWWGREFGGTLSLRRSTWREDDQPRRRRGPVRAGVVRGFQRALLRRRLGEPVERSPLGLSPKPSHLLSTTGPASTYCRRRRLGGRGLIPSLPDQDVYSQGATWPNY